MIFCSFVLYCSIVLEILYICFDLNCWYLLFDQFLTLLCTLFQIKMVETVKALWNLNTCLTKKGFFSCAIDTIIDIYVHVFDDYSAEIDSNLELGDILKSIFDMKEVLNSRKEWSKLREKL